MKRELAKLEALYLAMPEDARTRLVGHASGLTKAIVYVFRETPTDLRAAASAVLGAAIPKVLLLLGGMMKEEKFGAIFTDNAPRLCKGVQDAVTDGAKAVGAIEAVS